MLKRSLPVQLSACGPGPVQSFICVSVIARVDTVKFVFVVRAV